MRVGWLLRTPIPNQLINDALTPAAPLPHCPTDTVQAALPLMPSQITSSQNARIKGVVKLAKRTQREQRRVTVVEGEREVALALASGIVPLEAYVCNDLALSDSARALTSLLLSLDAKRDTLVSFVTR